MNRKFRVLSDTPFDEASLELLRRGIAPHELILPQVGVASVLATASYSVEGIDIVLGQPDPARVLVSESLRWVQLSSAGFTRYDTPEFRAETQARGVIFTNSSSVYDEPCAAQVLAFMLAETRQLPRSLKVRCDNRSPEWKELRHGSLLLRNQSVLILGYGAIARCLVRMLAPLGPRITALRRKPEGNEEVPIITFAELPEALASADHVVNILPDNADSRGFFTGERFGQMKAGAAFYNIGRGTTVDQDALAESLRSGHLGAAWLDVTDPEPLPSGHPLVGLENCYITPHIAGGHQNESESLIRHFLENFRRFLDGEPLRDRIF